MNITKNPAPSTPLLLSTRDAARALSVSERTLWQLTADGELPAVKIGKRSVRYHLADLTRFIESRKAAPASI